MVEYHLYDHHNQGKPKNLKVIPNTFCIFVITILIFSNYNYCTIETIDVLKVIFIVFNQTLSLALKPKVIIW